MNEYKEYQIENYKIIIDNRYIKTDNNTIDDKLIYSASIEKDGSFLYRIQINKTNNNRQCYELFSL